MDCPGHERVLAVSHGGVCWLFARLWVENYKAHIGNCAIFRYSYENGRFTLEEVIDHDFSALETK